jgi:hypothetical protein
MQLYSTDVLRFLINNKLKIVVEKPYPASLLKKEYISLKNADDNDVVMYLSGQKYTPVQIPVDFLKDFIAGGWVHLCYDSPEKSEFLVVGDAEIRIDQ